MDPTEHAKIKLGKTTRTFMIETSANSGITCSADISFVNRQERSCSEDTIKDDVNSHNAILIYLNIY